MTPSERLYQTALRHVGIREIYGPKNSEDIMRMFDVCGHSWVNSEETPWCSAFVNYICHLCDLPMTKSLRARSWGTSEGIILEGNILDIGDLQRGDLVLLWRRSRSSRAGHIAFFESAKDHEMELLGGNQSNKVCVKSYPYYRFVQGIRLA